MHPYIKSSIHPYIQLSIHPFIHPIIHPSNHHAIYLSIHPSNNFLSIYHHTYKSSNLTVSYLLLQCKIRNWIWMEHNPFRPCNLMSEDPSCVLKATVALAPTDSQHRSCSFSANGWFAAENFPCKIQGNKGLYQNTLSLLYSIRFCTSKNMQI